MALLGKILWVVGLVAWYLIRYPFERKARRVPVVGASRSISERVGLIVATLGIAVVPGLYVATGFPASANYPAEPWAIVLGAVAYAAALWLFRRSHKDLGRNWSITLEIRDQHRLVSSGIYRLIRHPMYASFWLMAIGQALLLPNWIAGLAGPLAIGVLFFLRVGEEERMMLRNFGEEYRAYMKRTKRIIPYVY